VTAVKINLPGCDVMQSGMNLLNRKNKKDKKVKDVCHPLFELAENHSKYGNGQLQNLGSSFSSMYCTVSACDVRAATLTEVFPSIFLSCKANARITCKERARHALPKLVNFFIVMCV
jgi:hypothetical protein